MHVHLHLKIHRWQVQVQYQLHIFNGFYPREGVYVIKPGGFFPAHHVWCSEGAPGPPQGPRSLGKAQTPTFDHGGNDAGHQNARGGHPAELEADYTFLPP